MISVSSIVGDPGVGCAGTSGSAPARRSLHRPRQPDRRCFRQYMWQLVKLYVNCPSLHRVSSRDLNSLRFPTFQPSPHADNLLQHFLRKVDDVPVAAKATMPRAGCTTKKQIQFCSEPTACLKLRAPSPLSSEGSHDENLYILTFLMAGMLAATGCKCRQQFGRLYFRHGVPRRPGL